MYLIARLFLNAIFLLIATYFMKGVEVSGFYSAIMTALFLGIVNAVIRPIFIFLTLPINILTLGLFTLVINGLLILFVASFVKGFEVSSFWAAVGLSIFLWIGSWLTNTFIIAKMFKQHDT
ncbi:phage holin family protein [Patescibacteria group bacterium AH-259-L05]|nr:phage holin family protein [Patescibacteria group bacterium AH-259-L05]